MTLFLSFLLSLHPILTAHTLLSVRWGIFDTPVCGSGCTGKSERRRCSEEHIMIHTAPLNVKRDVVLTLRPRLPARAPPPSSDDFGEGAN